jgi:xylan 1,4-beta-xylosidase
MKQSAESVVPITIAAGGPSKPLRPFFSAVGYVNVDFTLTAETRRMYDHFSSFHNHFRYIRMHNTLTAHGQGDRFLRQGGRDFGNPGDMRPGTADQVVRRSKEGGLEFDWNVLDEAYDIVVASGMRLIVETDFLPSCLRQNEELWYVPEDYTLWEATIRAFINHLQDRYGSREIEKWYFEVWNEPDIFPAWQRDPQSFFALYDYMERAVHSVNPRLKVGGPAVTQRQTGIELFEAFLRHCSSEVNYASGRIGARLDFLSVHAKAGTLEDTGPSSERIFTSLAEFKHVLKDYPPFDRLELFNDESGIVWGGNRGTADLSWLNFRNTHYAAGFVCKLVDQYCSRVQDDWGLNLSIMDIDNCQLQWEKSLFSGHRSLLTPLFRYPSTDLLRKSVFNAYVLLGRLGDERLESSCRKPDFGRKYGCLATRRGPALSLMIWNFEDGIDDEVNPRRFSLRIRKHGFSGRYRLMHFRIDSGHSNAYRTWALLGKPAEPDAEQIRALREHENLEPAAPVAEIEMEDPLKIAIELPMHGVTLLQLVPENGKAPKRPSWIKGLIEKGAGGGLQIFLKWTPSSEPDFFHYRLWRRRPGEKEFQLLRDHGSLNTAVFVDTDVGKTGIYQYRVQAVNASDRSSRYSEELAVRVS